MSTALSGATIDTAGPASPEGRRPGRARRSTPRNTLTPRRRTGPGHRHALVQPARPAPSVRDRRCAPRPVAGTTTSTILQNDQTWAALQLTVVQAAKVTLLNIVMGTVIAWVLVRDRFPGKSILNVIIDVPFALPTIVAGLVLLALYGPNSPIGINWAFTPNAVLLAFAFVTLPFIVRTVQPVLEELEADVEEAAASLGASRFTIFRRIILPSLVPGDLRGCRAELRAGHLRVRFAGAAQR